MPSGYSTVCELEAMARLVRWFTYIQLLNERVKLPEGKYTQFFFLVFLAFLMPMMVGRPCPIL